MAQPTIIIPARYHSTRLPGKLLLPLKDIPIIVRTARNAVEVAGIDNVIVATDSELICSECSKYGLKSLLTPSQLLTGSDRVVYAARSLGLKTVINLQGDEPFFPLASLHQFYTYTTNNPIQSIVAGFSYCTDSEHYASLKVPKILFSSSYQLLYTSRHPLPASKTSSVARSGFIQTCVYAYSIEQAICYGDRIIKGPIEQSEDLELLCALEYNIPVKMIPVTNSSLSIDTPEDYETARRLIGET